MDMWIGDLLAATAAAKEYKGQNFCVTSAVPAVDGIVFETTYFTYIKWYRTDGHIEEHAKDAWRKK
jgi:hypothetical protein